MFNNKIKLQLFASPGMENPDMKAKSEQELKMALKNAIEGGDSEEFARVQVEMAKGIEARILAEAKSALYEDTTDQAVMAKRGLNPLTTEETKFYNEVIGGESFSGTEKLMPPTIFDRVFEYLRLNHPILSEIQFVNTTGTTEWITRDGDSEAAWWGDLCEAIKKKLASAFKKESTGLYKLSAYVPVCKSMLDLGPAWLDRFVREILSESISIALEDAIINGDGDKKPIGMTKDLAGSVTLGVYPDKTAKPLTSFAPGVLGVEVMKPLTLGGKRVVDEVLFIVNPSDYWGKIFELTTKVTPEGKVVYNILPINAKIIQSAAMAEGKMVVGMARDYFMGVGSGEKIEYSDHYKFLDDERTYITKQYANGKPLENDRFTVFDISSLEAVTPEVTVKGTVKTKEQA